MTISTHPVILDTATVLKAAGAVTATANATAIDVGSGLVDGFVVVDITAVTTTADHVFDLMIQGADDAAFAGGVINLATVKLAAAATTGESADNRATGRLLIPVRNVRSASDAIKRYLRVRTVVAGTTGMSLTYSAYLTKKTHGTM